MNYRRHMKFRKACAAFAADVEALNEPVKALLELRRSIVGIFMIPSALLVALVGAIWRWLF